MWVDCASDVSRSYREVYFAYTNTLVRISQLAQAEAVVGGCIVEPDGCHLKNAQCDTLRWIEQ